MGIMGWATTKLERRLLVDRLCPVVSSLCHSKDFPVVLLIEDLLAAAWARGKDGAENQCYLKSTIYNV